MKKNDQAYQLDLKIVINTSRSDHYQEMCLLFDKPAFLNLLPKLREYYGITELIPLDKYQGYDFPDLEDIYGGGEAKIDLTKYKRVNQLKKTLPNFYDEVIRATELPLVIENECYLLCYEFNRPPYFYDVIMQAIYCGAVTEDHFRPTKLEIIDAGSLWFGPTLPPLAIFISSTSTYEDVKEEFRKAKELMKTDKRLSVYQYHIELAPNIRKYRDWYWERIKGKTYQQIADDWLEKNENENTTYLDILKAVKVYQKLLNT